MRSNLRGWTVLAICLLLAACAAKKNAQQAPVQTPPQPSAGASPAKTEEAERKKEIGPITIAVWDLEDMASRENAQPELGELLAAKVMETIQKKGGYAIIERERLAAARQELRVAESAQEDPVIRLQLGKKVGARQMILGGYQVVSGKMLLELHKLDVDAGKIVKSSQEEAPASSISSWLDAARKATENVLQE
jgi:hypothetical protein